MKSLKCYFYRACMWAGLVKERQENNLASSFFRGIGWPGLSHNVHEMLRAARYGDSIKMKALLEIDGADIHESINTALTLAARRGHTETAKLLLEAGADVHVFNDQPLRWAKECGHKEMVNMLSEWIFREQQKQSKSVPKPPH